MRVLAKVADRGVEPVERSRVLPPDERRAGLRGTSQGEGRAEGSLGELHPERRVSASLDTGDIGICQKERWTRLQEDGGEAGEERGKGEDVV